MARFSYFFSILLFCGPALIILWLKYHRIIEKYKTALLVTIILSVVFTAPADFFALQWHTWAYVNGTNSGIYLLTLPETYAFDIAVTGIVSMATFAYANRIDVQNTRNRQHRNTTIRNTQTARVKRTRK
jgi:lycopene cyclase domain-containing protein